jgi:hypothetical protein
MVEAAPADMADMMCNSHSLSCPDDNNKLIHMPFGEVLHIT